MIQTLDDLGFTLNYKKSVLIPTQRLTFFFCLIIDTVQFKVFLTEEKIEKNKVSCEIYFEKKGRCLSSFYWITSPCVLLCY